MEEFNPYQPPKVLVRDIMPSAPEVETLATVPNHCDTSHAMQWIKGGFVLFKEQPALSIGCTVTSMVIMFIMAFMPIISMFSGLVNMTIHGGMMLLASKLLKSPDTAKFSDVFAGFNKFSRFVVLFLIQIGIYCGAMLVFAILAAIAFGVTTGFSMGVFNQLMQNPASLDALQIVALTVLFLLFFVTMLVIAAYIWALPTLIMFHDDLGFGEAMKLSASAARRNLGTAFVYFLLAFVLSLACLLTLGLGFFVLIPVFYFASYLAYRDIFLEKSAVQK